MRLRPPDPAIAWPGGGLRPWREADAPVLVEAWQDAEIARWNPVPTDPSEERARRWIAGVETRLRDGLSLDLCILDRAQRVVGEVGLSGFDEARRAALIGYWLLPGARGRGIATTAVEALSVWATTRAGLRVLVARCASANPASRAVARRARYTLAGRAGDVDLYAYEAAADDRRPLLP